MERQSLFNKIKTHVKNVASAKSLHFTLRVLDGLIARRIFSTTRHPERHLLPYMKPRHRGCFVDVGANVGLWTLYMLKRKVRVYAFEPSSVPFELLKSYEKDYPDLLKTYPVALGDTEKVGQLLLHSSPGHNSLSEPSQDFTGNTLKVNVKTLDSFNLQNVGLIKIDTQGYESQVLLGAKETILKNKPRLIIEIHREEQIKEIAEITEDLGYRVFMCYRRGFVMPNALHIIGDEERSLR